MALGLVVQPAHGDEDEGSKPPPAPPSTALQVAPVEPRSEQELARFTELMDVSASQSRAYHVWGGVSILAVGALTIPAGVFMNNRDDNPVASAVGPMVLGLGALEALAGGMLVTSALFENEFDRISSVVQQEKAAGKSAREILGRAESQWRNEAFFARRRRRIVGILQTGSGVVLVGAAGAYLAFVDASASQQADRSKFGFSAAMLGVGALEVVLGVRALLLEDPVETAWRTYEATKAREVSSLKFRGVSVAPTSAGGVLTFNATF